MVESTESDSDCAPADHFKQQDFDDQIGNQRKLVADAKDPVRRGSTVLNQNRLDVKTSQEETENVKEVPNLSVKRSTSQKCQKLKESHQNNFKRSPDGEKRLDPIQNAQHEATTRRSSIDDNRDLEATAEVKRILEELESIKQRISQIEHSILNKIVW